ncbi:MAG: DNA repair protein RecO [Oscillospiraceae bacterium]|nr:DNA repair protein RecO [Oscillospiraceae bacterium]
MYINTKGLVLREVVYKETSKILTVLTPDEGRITVSAKGARRKGSRIAAATQLFAFSDMTLSHNRDRWTLTEAQCIESFSGLSDELERAALGAYFCELLEAVSDEAPNPEILSLGLNALYALGQEKKPEAIVKAAFELRLMCHAGFAPALEGCCVCGRPDVDHPRLDLENGTARCRDCKSGSLVSAVLCQSSLEAMRYIVSCDRKRLYAFTLGPEAASRLGRACEQYVTTQLDRGFSTLGFYHSL